MVNITPFTHFTPSFFSLIALVISLHVIIYGFMYTHFVVLDTISFLILIFFEVCFFAILKYFSGNTIAKTKYPKIIGITGRKYSGKDTFADYISKKYGYTKICYADPLKTVCGTLFSLSEEQLYGDKKEVSDPRWFDLTPRQILQFVGTELFRTNMAKLCPNFEDKFWLHIARNNILTIQRENPNALIVVSDIRFCNELDLIHELNGITFRVERPAINSNDKHESESYVDNLDVNITIKNDKTVNDFYKEIDYFFNIFKV